MISSTPNLEEFDPREIPWQYELVKDIRKRFDYKVGTHECLLSGSLGSGKSLPVAHVIATHCLFWPGANFGIGRRTLPDLKDTLCQKIREHLFNTGVEYSYNKTSGDFEICNGSKITTFSWADGNYKKFGSYELSAFAMEEAQENEESTAYEFALSRVNRLPHVKEPVVLALANPDDPGHWLAKRFSVGSGRPTNVIEHPTRTRHVYYSRTEQNKFLPPEYIQGLKENMDPKLARRLLYGEWVEINAERVYYAYDMDRNFRPNEDYVIDQRYPVRIAWDFNIALGKPLSVVLFQYIDDTFHVFDEVVVEGMRTEDSLDEIADRGHLDLYTKFVVHGDASGKHSDTRNKKSDYDIIRKYLANYRTKPNDLEPDGRKLDFEIQVPLSNPPLRARHNTVNAYCFNEAGQVRVVGYRKCKVWNEGMRLTKLRDSAQLIEDDSKAYQHITTAFGYGVMSSVKNMKRKPQGMVQL